MDKPLLHNAMLGSKDEVAMIDVYLVTDFYLDIEVEGVVEGVKRSYYFVSLHVGGIKVAESTKSKARSSVVNLEWKENNQM
jgi:hypothetical protein